MHVWNFQPVWAHADLLVLGLANTLKVTAAALFFGMPLGLTLALMRLSQAKVFKWPSSLVIEVFRTTPPLVQLFWFFFALPILVNVEMTPYIAAVLTFSIQSAAFFAEVFREQTFCEEKFKLILLHSLLKGPTFKLACFREAFRLYFANYL